MDALDLLIGRQCRRLGIMGGSFDPIHVGHLVAATEALEQFELDHMVFMPAGTPPHKTTVVTAGELRYQMTCVATAGNSRFWVSRYELDHEGTDYTVDTLAYVHALFGESTDLYFVTGADAVLDILGWKEPDRLLGLASLIAATRPGYDLGRLERVLAGLSGRERVKVMDIPALAISSTMIRERVAAGRSISYLVPIEVERLIAKWGLYTPQGYG